MSMRNGAALAFGSILSLILSACSSSLGGEPVQSGGAPTGVSPSQSGSGSDLHSLADIDPCSLVSAEDLAEYGDLRVSEEVERFGARSCTYKKKRKNALAPDLGISVGIRDDQGVDEARPAQRGIQRTEADGREYAQIPSAGGCTIVIGVTETSRVDIVTNTVQGTEKSCEIADEVGAIVEPKLPKG